MSRHLSKNIVKVSVIGAETLFIQYYAFIIPIMNADCIANSVKRIAGVDLNCHKVK
jgi:hypothetical protein